MACGPWDGEEVSELGRRDIPASSLAGKSRRVVSDKGGEEIRLLLRWRLLATIARAPHRDRPLLEPSPDGVQGHSRLRAAHTGTQLDVVRRFASAILDRSRQSTDRTVRGPWRSWARGSSTPNTPLFERGLQDHLMIAHRARAQRAEEETRGIRPVGM